MRNFDTLDTSSFRAFWAASETLNFTRAAKVAGLTQSGISQHISRLEKQLGVPLFERVNKRVYLTEAGSTLRGFVDNYLDQMDALKEKMGSQNAELTGTVSYAMPASCLMSPHLPALLARRQKHFPKVRLDIQLCPSEQVAEKLLSNEIQFGFLTKKVEVAGLQLRPYCNETYVLVGSSKSQLKEVDARCLRELPFVEHPGVEEIFELWRRNHFPKSAGLSWSALTVAGKMNNLSGAIRMAEGGVGLTVVPEHCVIEELQAGRLFKYSSPTRADTLSQIYLATREEAQLPKRTQKIMETFFEVAH